MNIPELIMYWQNGYVNAWETAGILYKNKRYSDCLFFGHITLEKVLKAYVVRHTKKQAPYTHNLSFLHDLAELGLPEEELDLLDTVNDFNIRARYPEQKFSFYKKCTRSYTKEYVNRIVRLYVILCRRITQKR